MFAKLNAKQVCVYCVRVTFTAVAAALFLYGASKVYSNEPTVGIVTKMHIALHGETIAPAYLRKEFRNKLQLRYSPETLNQKTTEGLPTLEQFVNRKNQDCKGRKNAKDKKMAERKEYRPRQTNGNAGQAKGKPHNGHWPILPPAYPQVMEDEQAEKERISAQFDLDFWER